MPSADEGVVRRAEPDEYERLTRKGWRRAQGIAQDKKSPRLSIVRTVAQFCHVWPGLYISPAWPTTDHIIPWSLFWVLYAELHTVLALDRVNITRAVGHWQVNDAARRSGMDADRREAFPELQETA